MGVDRITETVTSPTLVCNNWAMTGAAAAVGTMETVKAIKAIGLFSCFSVVGCQLPVTGLKRATVKTTSTPQLPHP